MVPDRVNMLLLPQHASQRLYCVTLTNIDAVFLIDEPTDKQAIAQLLAHIPLLMLRVDVLTPPIIERVWGEDNMVRRHSNGPRGDLAIIRHCLISLACVRANVANWLDQLKVAEVGGLCPCEMPLLE